jgi:hypothetical protein
LSEPIRCRELPDGAVQHVLCFLFARIYRRWLWNAWYGNYDKVLIVRGWRTALTASGKAPEYRAQRQTVTPCFWWFD